MLDKRCNIWCWLGFKAKEVFLLTQRSYVDGGDMHVLDRSFKTSIHKTCSCSQYSCGKNSIDCIAVGTRNSSLFLRTRRIISKFALKQIQTDVINA